MAGTLWIDDAASLWRLKLYDGADDIQIGIIDPTTNEFVPAARKGHGQGRFEYVSTAQCKLVPYHGNQILLWDAGLSYNEIAAQTGLSVGAIGTTLARARRRLADAYEELEESYAARG